MWAIHLPDEPCFYSLHLTGIQAYDSHCNLVLGEVEETVYVVDDEAGDDDVKTVSKKSEMLFVRG